MSNCKDGAFPDIDKHDELPRLLSSADLLRNPFVEGDRFADNVTITGKVSRRGDTLFIDIDDNTPAAVSKSAKDSIMRQFSTCSPISISEIEGGVVIAL